MRTIRSAFLSPGDNLLVCLFYESLLWGIVNWQFICIISLSLYLAQKLFILLNLVWLAFGFDSGLNNIVLIKRKFVFLIWMAGDEFKLYNAVRGRFSESAVLSHLIAWFIVLFPKWPCTWARSMMF